MTEILSNGWCNVSMAYCKYLGIFNVLNSVWQIAYLESVLFPKLMSFATEVKKKKKSINDVSINISNWKQQAVLLLHITGVIRGLVVNHEAFGTLSNLITISATIIWYYLTFVDENSLAIGYLLATLPLPFLSLSGIQMSVKSKEIFYMFATTLPFMCCRYGIVLNRSIDACHED